MDTLIIVSTEMYLTYKPTQTIHMFKYVSANIRYKREIPELLGIFMGKTSLTIRLEHIASIHCTLYISFFRLLKRTSPRN